MEALSRQPTFDMENRAPWLMAAPALTAISPETLYRLSKSHWDFSFPGDKALFRYKPLNCKC